MSAVANGPSVGWILTLEYETAQKGIELYNRILFAVKGWALTVFSGFVTVLAAVISPTNGATTNRGAVSAAVTAMIVVLVVFWILDGQFKSLQRVYIKRASEVENGLRIAAKAGDRGIHERWSDDEYPQLEARLNEWDRHIWAGTGTCLFRSSVWLFHLPLILLLLIVGGFAVEPGILIAPGIVMVLAVIGLLLVWYRSSRIHEKHLGVSLNSGS